MNELYRKGVLFGLITLAVINDPLTREYFKPDDIKQQEKALNEYFEDVSKLGMTVPAHHLNRLADVDKPVIKSKGFGNYNINLTLDNGKKIEFDVNTSFQNDNKLLGYFKSDNGTLLKYSAVFNPQNPEEFEIYIRNKENTVKYQAKLKEQEGLDKYEFFTTKNDMWRKLNLILLFLLTINEWGYDIQKRKEKNKK